MTEYINDKEDEYHPSLAGSIAPVIVGIGLIPAILGVQWIFSPLEEPTQEPAQIERVLEKYDSINSDGVLDKEELGNLLKDYKKK